MCKIKYRDGYKYQLAEDYQVPLIYSPENDICTKYIKLSKLGELQIKEGYAWDGPSGPTFDTPTFMRGSLIHDALYQLVREEYLPLSWKNKADRELERICIMDGMNKIRAKVIYKAVQKFASFACSPKNNKPIITAP